MENKQCEKFEVLAVDIGGSSTRTAIVCDKEITDLREAKTETLPELLSFVGEGVSLGTQGIAYSVGGVIPDHNKIIVSPNRHFLDGIELGRQTVVKFKKPAVVCNDMEAAAMGMAKMFPSVYHFLGITLSSGIGAREFQDGKILGDSEAGHMQLDSSPFATLCGCKKRGCAETLVGEHLQARVVSEAKIWEVTTPPGYKYPSMFLHEEYDKGHPWAVGIYKQLIWGMARFLSNIITFRPVPAIIFKGGLGRQLLTRTEPQIRALMREMLINPAWAEGLDFYFCWEVEPCKDADALIGAADVLLQGMRNNID